MSGTAWSKFFWSDWASDPALRLCSLAAQGLWMRCLCVAAESDPTGYVAVNGRPLGVTDIALLAGVTETEAAAHIDALERNGVFSRDRNGCIYNRRMVRDAKLHKIAQKNGKKGGNPNLRARSEIPAPDNPQLNSQDKGEDNTHKPEARVQKKNNNRNGLHPYAFEHGCVRLTQRDIDKWRKAFPHVAIEAELIAAEPWLAKQPNWYTAAAGLLAKREREAVQRGAPAEGRRREIDPYGNWIEVGT